MYDFQLQKISGEIKKRKAKKILIQLPEGLKQHAPQILDELQKTGVDIVLSGDPCFGACDLRNLDDFDLCIHFGHSKILENKKVIYIPVYDNIQFSDLIKKAIQKFNLKKPGIVTTIQHIQQLPKKYKLMKGRRSNFEGQVLGCDFQTISDKDVDAIILIGSGRFHALGIKSKTEKPVILINPYDKTITEVTADFEKEKYLRVSKAEKAKTWAVVIGEKPGQKNLVLATKAFKELKSKGKKVYKVLLDNCSPDVIDYLPFDAFVITACPRIVLDDWKNYEKPVLLVEEINLL